MDRKPHGTADFVIKGLIHLEALACFSVHIHSDIRFERC